MAAVLLMVDPKTRNYGASLFHKNYTTTKGGSGKKWSDEGERFVTARRREQEGTKPSPDSGEVGKKEK